MVFPTYSLSKFFEGNVFGKDESRRRDDGQTSHDHPIHNVDA